MVCPLARGADCLDPPPPAYLELPASRTNPANSRLRGLMADPVPFGTETGWGQKEETDKSQREQLERIQKRLKTLADQMVKIRRSHRKGLYTDEDFRDEREAITEKAQQLQEEAQRLKDEGYSEERG